MAVDGRTEAKLTVLMDNLPCNASVGPHDQIGAGTDMRGHAERLRYRADLIARITPYSTMFIQALRDSESRGLPDKSYFEAISLIPTK